MLRVATATSPSSEDHIAVHAIPGGVIVIAAGGDGARRIVGVALHAVADRTFDPFSAVALAGLMRNLDRSLRSGETSAVMLTVWERHLWGASVGRAGAFVAHERGTDDLTENRISRSRIGSGTARPAAFERAEWRGCVVAVSEVADAAIGPGALGRIVLQGDVDQAPRRLVGHVLAQPGQRGAEVAVAVVQRTGR